MLSWLSVVSCYRDGQIRMPDVFAACLCTRSKSKLQLNTRMDIQDGRHKPFFWKVNVVPSIADSFGQASGPLRHRRSFPSSFFLLHEALDVLCRVLKAGKDIAAEDKRKILHDQSDPCWNIWIWIMKPKSLLLMALGLPGQECLGHLALSQYMFASGCWCFDCFWHMVRAGLGVQDSEVNFARTAEACCHVMKTQLERESMQASSALCSLNQSSEVQKYQEQQSPRYDWVLWIDCDAFFMDPGTDATCRL